MDLLSSQEMTDTEGELFPFWIIDVGLRFTANNPWVRHHVRNFALGYRVYSWAGRMHNRWR